MYNKFYTIKSKLKAKFSLLNSYLPFKVKAKIALPSLVAIAIMVPLSIFGIAKITEANHTNATELTNTTASQEVINQRNAIVETAKTYMRRGVKLQYAVTLHNPASSPEDITLQRFGYVECSAFAYAVYQNASTIKTPPDCQSILQYGINNKGTPNVVKVYPTHDEVYSDSVLGKDTDRSAILAKEWSQILEPGDVLVESVKPSGHTMLVESVDKANQSVKLIHSTGNFYNWDQHYAVFDKNGTVNETDLASRLHTIYQRKNVDGYAIIRPITNGTTWINQDGQTESYTMQDSASTRLAFPGLDISKTVQANDGTITREAGQSAALEDTLTYTITVKNSSSAKYTSTLPVVENIDSRLSIVNEGEGSLNANQLSWTIPQLNAGQTYTINYSVKIPKDNSLLNQIINTSGKVGNIPTSKIETRIVNHLKQDEKNKLRSEFQSARTDSTTERDFLNNIYKNSLNINLGLSNDLKNLDIIGYDTADSPPPRTNGVSIRHTHINNTTPASIEKAIYNNMYGLRIGNTAIPAEGITTYNNWRNTVHEANDRARNLTNYILAEDGSVIADGEVLLDDGDILLAYTEPGINGPTTDVTNTEDDITEITSDDNDIDAVNTPTTDNADLVQKSYIFFRSQTHPKGALYRKTATNQLEIFAGYDMTRFLLNMAGGDNYIVLRPIQLVDRNPAVTYTLSYDANGGSGAPSSQSCSSTTGSCSITISSTKPTRGGYTFKGWATSSTATTAQYQPGQSIKLSKSNTTLYAVWEQDTPGPVPPGPDPGPTPTPEPTPTPQPTPGTNPGTGTGTTKTPNTGEQTNTDNSTATIITISILLPILMGAGFFVGRKVALKL